MRAAVVVTTYNNPKYLGICLKSFSNQTCRDFDIFHFDPACAASTDTEFTVNIACDDTRHIALDKEGTHAMMT